MPFKVVRLFANSKNRDALNGQLDFFGSLGLLGVGNCSKNKLL